MQKFGHNIGFWEKRTIFISEKCQKSQKIVIITSNPGWPDEFVKKIAQNVAQTIFIKINAQLYHGKTLLNIWATSVIQKLT
jgi:hypothetical protein